MNIWIWATIKIIQRRMNDALQRKTSANMNVKGKIKICTPVTEMTSIESFIRYWAFQKCTCILQNRKPACMTEWNIISKLFAIWCNSWFYSLCSCERQRACRSSVILLKHIFRYTKYYFNGSNRTHAYLNVHIVHKFVIVNMSAKLPQRNNQTQSGFVYMRDIKLYFPSRNDIPRGYT